MDREIKRIFIHHTGSRILRCFDSPWLVGLRHRLRGFDEIGYHYLIGNGYLTQDGKICAGRNVEKQGAHTYGCNHDSIGICLLGNFNSRYPTPAQMNSLISLCRETCERYRLRADNILGHREMDDETECPGDFVNMDSIREAVRTALQSSFRQA